MSTNLDYYYQQDYSKLPPMSKKDFDFIHNVFIKQRDAWPLDTPEHKHNAKLLNDMFMVALDRWAYTQRESKTKKSAKSNSLT